MNGSWSSPSSVPNHCNFIEGSGEIVDTLGPGVVGGVLVPIFGAAPQAIIILATIVFGSVKVAQDQVYIGMDLLAGLTVLLITVISGDCLLVGKFDIENSVAVDNQDTKAFDLIDLFVDPQQILMGTVAIALRTIGYGIELQQLKGAVKTSPRALWEFGRTGRIGVTLLGNAYLPLFRHNFFLLVIPLKKKT
ncbi:hypothetical protein L2E82_35670 [Cichorium intybus]|uniref:Uncharacterized protein n=1 Tax=Cichorium intybus TaxID=13427 RepID=A0ACB9BPP7_CICIN|nr:hypothetical protein L2E82_35670 [Cichorium intybus]